MFKKLLTSAVVGGLALIPLGAGAAHADGTAEPAAESSQCRFGHWPADAQGRPSALATGAAAGAYLWHGEDGWHLFVTHPGDDRRVFTGSITSESRIHDVARRTERNDSIVRKSAHRVTFSFQNYGRLDGVDFRMTCGRSFTVRVNAPIFVGHDAAPHASPVTITRSK